MSAPNVLIQKLKRQLSGKFIRNVGWLAGAEFVNRIFRLATTVTLARSLTSYEYGLIAIVFTTIEFANVFTLRGGMGSKLIQASEQDVKVLSDTTYWLNWIICSSIFVLQCIAALPIAWFYKSNQVILPIWTVSLVYLIMPLFNVQASLIQRENRMNVIALANTIASFLVNTLTVVLALRGMGMWSVVIPYVLSHSAWLIVYLKNHPWRPSGSFTLNRSHEILIFAKNVLGVELLDKLRANLDYLLVGRFLGVEALGIYYFAFNAGLGISLNVIGVFWYTLLPHLCAARGNMMMLKEKYFSSMKSMALVAIPIVLLQASLAPFYVPIIFGEKWATAIPILILICLSALPRPFALAASQLLLTVDKGQVDLYWNLIFTVIFAASLLVAVQWGIISVASCVLVVHLIALPIFIVLATRYVFSYNGLSSSAK
ncbi:MAG TPA: lipopolysaccharide biosynthesis protein [Coleofasciculaceae cyanobacterium]